MVVRLSSRPDTRIVTAAMPNSSQTMAPATAGAD
jgi:hypothetical protein